MLAHQFLDAVREGQFQLLTKPGKHHVLHVLKISNHLMLCGGTDKVVVT
jgi:hypothetical protein